MNNVVWSNWDLDTNDPVWNEALDAEYLNECLECERTNLDIKLDGMIIVIADLGLWNGRRTGYKIISSGNIKDCLYDDCDYITWYCDNYNFRAVAIHHDGINRYLYRVFREGLDRNQIGRFLDNLIKGEADDRMIRRYTKSIRPEIANVYGWN